MRRWLGGREAAVLAGYIKPTRPAASCQPYRQAQAGGMRMTVRQSSDAKVRNSKILTTSVFLSKREGLAGDPRRSASSSTGTLSARSAETARTWLPKPLRTDARRDAAGRL